MKQKQIHRHREQTHGSQVEESGKVWEFGVSRCYYFLRLPIPWLKFWNWCGCGARDTWKVVSDVPGESVFQTQSHREEKHHLQRGIPTGVFSPVRSTFSSSPTPHDLFSLKSSSLPKASSCCFIRTADFHSPLTFFVNAINVQLFNS